MHVYRLEREHWVPRPLAEIFRFFSDARNLALLTPPRLHFEIVDAPGNLALRTSSADVRIENPGGKVNVDNRNGNIDVRYSVAPKDDIQITNSSSEITLSLPSKTNFEIVADCHSCDINSDFAGSGLNQTTTKSGDSHLEGKYGSGRSIRIILRTSYGSINIRKTS